MKLYISLSLYVSVFFSVYVCVGVCSVRTEQSMKVSDVQRY